MKRLIGILVFAALLSSSFELIAYEYEQAIINDDGSDDESLEGKNSDVCFSLPNPWRCLKAPTCEWSHRLYRCVPKNGNEVQRCETVISRRTCEARIDCFWSLHRGRCVTKDTQ